MTRLLSRLGIWGSWDYPINEYARMLLNRDANPTRWIGFQLLGICVFVVVGRRKPN